MIEFGEGDLQALERLNALRAEGPSAELRKLERRFNARFGAGRRLAVYGSLAPGEANHQQVAALRGEWFSGLTVRGRLYDSGWGVARGFPGLRWSAAEGAVPVHLLVSRDLPLHWRRLDRFEGAEYRRILVPLYRGAELAEVANLYEISRLEDRGGDGTVDHPEDGPVWEWRLPREAT